jgi:hypothetical protein
VRGRNRFHTAAHINIPTLRPESERSLEGLERELGMSARVFAAAPNEVVVNKALD